MSVSTTRSLYHFLHDASSQTITIFLVVSRADVMTNGFSEVVKIADINFVRELSAFGELLLRFVESPRLSTVSVYSQPPTS